jgi:hypothetical protein
MFKIIKLCVSFVTLIAILICVYQRDWISLSKKIKTKGLSVACVELARGIVFVIMQFTALRYQLITIN